MQRRQLLAVAGLVLAPRSASAAGGWVQVADMPVSRSEMPATVHDGLIYVAGGFGAGNLAHRYDPETDEWEQIADLPADVNHAGITTFNDQVVVAGGYGPDGSTAHSEIWACSPDGDSWEQIGQLPDKIGAFGFVTATSTLFIVGGATGSLNGEPSAAMWSWDADRSRWEARAPMSHPREHLATVSVDEAIYAIGGRAHGRDDDALGGAAERYDPEEDEWTTLPPMPYPRSGLNGAAVAGSVVVAGGETSGQVFAQVQRFDIGAETWASLPDLPVAVHGVALAALGNALYAIGGSTEAGRIRNVASVSKLETDF
jgi:N-acetylneuraminic acid mutarotase